MTMNDETKLNEENISAPTEEAGPVHDPHNKLYTVLSLLIFAVCYISYRLIAANVTLTYALHCDAPADELQTAVCAEMGIDSLPDGWDVEYIRLHKGFDSDRLYLSIIYGEDEPDAPEDAIPFPHGDPSDEQRYSVYPDDNMRDTAVFGQMYTNSADPFENAVIYERDDGYHILFSTSSYDSGIRGKFPAECEKIVPDNRGRYRNSTDE